MPVRVADEVCGAHAQRCPRGCPPLRSESINGAVLALCWRKGLVLGVRRASRVVWWWLSCTSSSKMHLRTLGCGGGAAEVGDQSLCLAPPIPAWI